MRLQAHSISILTNEFMKKPYSHELWFVGLFCGLSSLSMYEVMSRRSVNIIKLFLGKRTLSSLRVLNAHTLACAQQHPLLNQWKEENDHRKYFMINSHETWGWTEIELTTQDQQSNSLPTALQGLAHELW